MCYALFLNRILHVWIYLKKHVFCMYQINIWKYILKSSLTRYWWNSLRRSFRSIFTLTVTCTSLSSAISPSTEESPSSSSFQSQQNCNCTKEQIPIVNSRFDAINRTCDVSPSSTSDSSSASHNNTINVANTTRHTRKEFFIVMLDSYPSTIRWLLFHSHHQYEKKGGKPNKQNSIYTLIC